MSKTLSKSPGAPQGMNGGVIAGTQAWRAPGGFMIDTMQRTIRLWGVLRQRGGQYYVLVTRARWENASKAVAT